MILTLPVSEFLYSVSKTLGPYIFDVNVDSYDDLVSLLSQKGIIRGKIENEEMLERGEEILHFLNKKAYRLLTGLEKLS